MTATSLLVDEVRDWTGSEWPADDDPILTQLERFDDDPQKAARALLKRLVADIEGGYSGASTSGDFTWSRSPEFLKGLRDKVARLDNLIGDTDAQGGATLTQTPIQGPEDRRVPVPWWPW